MSTNQAIDRQPVVDLYRRQVADLDIRAVAQALGLPVRGDRFQVAWRKGDSWSGSINRSIGGWIDHKTGDKGGIIDLVRFATGCDRTGARTWLEDNFDLAPLVERTPAEKQEYASRVALARQMAEKLALARERILGEIEANDKSILERYDQLDREAHAEEDIDKFIQAVQAWTEHEEACGWRKQISGANGPELVSLIAQYMRRGATV